MELVNRYFADNDSVSLERLHANYDSAADAADAASAAVRIAVDNCNAARKIVEALEVIVDAAVDADMEAEDAEDAAKKAFFQKVVDVSY